MFKTFVPISLSISYNLMLPSVHLRLLSYIAEMEPEPHVCGLCANVTSALDAMSLIIGLCPARLVAQSVPKRHNFPSPKPRLGMMVSEDQEASFKGWYVATMLAPNAVTGIVVKR